MEIKRGIPVSPGVAFGPALVLDTEGYRIPQRFIEGDRAEAEVLRLRQALAAASQEARENQLAINDKLGKQYGAIFAAHAHMIEDPALHREIESLIRDNGYAAEYAVGRIMRMFASRGRTDSRSEMTVTFSILIEKSAKFLCARD